MYLYVIAKGSQKLKKIIKCTCIQKLMTSNFNNYFCIQLLIAIKVLFNYLTGLLVIDRNNRRCLL